MKINEDHPNEKKQVYSVCNSKEVNYDLCLADTQRQAEEQNRFVVEKSGEAFSCTLTGGYQHGKRIEAWPEAVGRPM